MDKLAELSKKVEIDFLKTISVLLEKGKITLPQSKQLAREFLSLLPFTSEDDMQNKIKSYVNTHLELVNLQGIVLSSIDEDHKVKLIEDLRAFIQNSK
jgi:hypothetical protein